MGVGSVWPHDLRFLVGFFSGSLLEPSKFEEAGEPAGGLDP